MAPRPRPTLRTLHIVVCVSSAGTLSIAAYVAGLRNPLASMASYTAALMVLNQVVPPLILSVLPPHGRISKSIVDVIFDPVVAFVAFTALGVAVSVPAFLDPTLANALYAGPLGLLELLTGLALWGQITPATRQIRSNLHLGLMVWLASLPMSAVAVIWMLAPRVLYTPFLDVMCRWNLPPLLDQKWAGLIMFAAGMPMQFSAAWVLLGLSRPKTTSY